MTIHLMMITSVSTKSWRIHKKKQLSWIITKIMLKSPLLRSRKLLCPKCSQHQILNKTLGQFWGSVMNYYKIKGNKSNLLVWVLLISLMNSWIYLIYLKPHCPKLKVLLFFLLNAVCQISIVFKIVDDIQK